MALTVDYSSAPFLITVPKTDLTLDAGTKYELTVDEFWSLLTDFSDNEQVMSQPPLYTRVAATATTPSITNIDLAYYTIEFEDGLYSVNIINGNTNIREAEEKNQVSVNTNNTAGFIDTAVELGYIQKFIWLNVDLLVNGDGSQKSPFNDATDAIDYAEAQNIRHIHLHSDLTIDRQMKNFVFEGQGTPTVDTAGFDIDGSSFFQCSLQGTFVGTIIAQECVLLPNCYLNGYYETCGLAGDLFCVDGGNVLMTQCISLIAGLGRPTINMTSTLGVKLGMRKNGGGITIKGCDHADSEVTVEVSEGSLTFDSSNTTTTANSMVARGWCKFVNAVPTAGVVVDETGAALNWVYRAALTIGKFLALKDA